MAGRIAYYGNIVTQGLVLNLDAAIQGSYPKTGLTWVDISNNGNNGTLTNGPSYTGSDYGAIVFDGVDDYVLVNKTIMADAPAGTFDIWLNLTTTSPSTYSGVSNILIGKPSSPDNAFGFSSNTGKLLLKLGNVTNLISSVSVSTGSWQLGQGVWDSTGMSIYQNGSPVSSVAVSGLTWFGGTTHDTVLGRNYVSSANGSFTGRIGGVKVYNQALSQFEIFQNFNAMKGRYGIPDIVTDGLVLNLDAGNPYSYLSGSSGTTWTDVSGEGNNGTLTNGASYANGAISFDGVDDYVDCGVTNISLPTNITLTAWINQSTLVGYKNIITKEGTTSTDLDYGLTTSPNGNLYFWFHNGSYRIHETFTDSINQTSTWYNVAAVFNDTNNTVQLYVNGTQIYNQSETTSMLAHTNSKLFVGWRNSLTPGQSFNGKIVNTQVYNRALSQEEITQNFNALRGRYGI